MKIEYDGDKNYKKRMTLDLKKLRIVMFGEVCSGTELFAETFVNSKKTGEMRMIRFRGGRMKRSMCKGLRKWN